MHNKTLSISHSKNKEQTEGDIYTMTNGITKRLLEKYKPNDNVVQIDSLNERTLENRAV